MQISNLLFECFVSIYLHMCFFSILFLRVKSLHKKKNCPYDLIYNTTQVKLIYFDSVLCGHSYLMLLFGIDCLFIVLFTKQMFIFPKIYIVYFTKHQRRRSSNRSILVRVTYLKFT